jgi:ABC-type sugar transport system ATPase subunit
MNILAINQTDRGVRLANGTEMALPGIAGPVAELGIRPEHLDIADPAHAPLTGTADVVEHLGSDTNAYILVDGVGPLMVRQHGHVPLRAGDHVGLTVQPGQIHAFAPDGRALRA